MKCSAREFAAVLGAVLVVTFMTLLPLCNLLFSCGCNFTGAFHCNIHHAAGPMCPWCSHGNSVFVLGYGVSLLGVTVCILAALKLCTAHGRLVVAFASGVVGYVVGLSLAGLATSLYFHYPTWYGLHL